MGEVYKAEDLKLGQTVALKFLPENFAEDKAARERFYGEVRTARQVSHPNVCRVFDIGDVEGSHFLSMEFIDGDDLSSLLRRIGRLPPDKAVEIGRQLCAGLHAIHQAGVLHRDLKPANVIIDGRGRARITDFGIAGLESDLKDGKSIAGTPAYMSPEQITGKELTTKSDIYSLGLVLYEVFTGKQAFAGNTIDELIRKHQTATPTNPSEYIKDIDPLVEQVIFRCLEKDPRERPASALQVAMMLPGGDPLEAAIAAGETPSPEMVAAAPKKGALRPGVAVACLTALIAAFGLAIFLNARYKVYSFTPLDKSPEILADRSKSILIKLGYTNAPTDAAYKFSVDPTYLNYSFQNDLLSGLAEKLRAGQPLAIYFWYRQSPRYLEPTGSSKVTETDPPLAVSNMANVKLDARGRLVEFIAVPPQTDTKAGKTETDWSTVFAEAGLDIAKFKPTEPQWTPPVFADERKAWEGVYADFPDTPIRIESAAYAGRPVYFRVVAPWDKPAREEEASVNVFYKAAGVVVIIAYVLVLIGAILLARHNLKVGRGDVRGGLKLSIFYFLVSFLGQAIYADHVPTINGELTVLYEMASYSLLATAFVGLIYIALEPFVRRWWSELLISWNRLLAGDLRDPMIGRDVLVGGLLGIGHSLAIYLGTFLTKVLGKGEIIGGDFDINHLSGAKGIIAGLADVVSGAIPSSLMLLFLLLLFYVVLRNKRLSVLALGVIITSILSLAFVFTSHWVYAIPALMITTLMLTALTRFGLLALISFTLFFSFSWQSPFTFNTSSFYFPSTVTTVALALGLALYGFFTSLAGQPLFKRKLLED